MSRSHHWFLLAAIFVAAPLVADDEAGNVAHVKSSSYGRCYAKSVPAESYGDKGTTRVYAVGEPEDTLLRTFEWFSQQIFLECNISDSRQPVGVAVARTGPWQRGHQAAADHLAIAFYFKGTKTKEYSTLDIAGSPDNVSASVSHYTVIEKIPGFRWLRSNEYVFEIKTSDGRKLAFDPVTGSLLPKSN